MAFFAWLESSGFSMWIKESRSIWPYDVLCLSLHAIGMALLVGVSSAVALRILGYAPRLPLAPMAGLFPVMYTGFWINALSGVGLLIAYPVKAVTNPVFYLKLAGVTLAVLCIRRIRRRVFVDPVRLERGVGTPGRILAAMLLGIWVATITAGRLLAYRDVARVERETAIGVVIVTGLMVLGWYVAGRRWRRSFELGAATTGEADPARGR